MSDKVSKALKKILVKARTPKEFEEWCATNGLLHPVNAAMVAKEVSGDHILATTVGRGQAAITLAETRPDAGVSLWFHDQYQQQLLVRAVQEFPARLGLYCEADAPARPQGGQYDLAVVPVSFHVLVLAVAC